MSLKEDFTGQNVEKQSWLPTKFFQKSQNMYGQGRKCKKNSKNPGTVPVPGKGAPLSISSLRSLWPYVKSSNLQLSKHSALESTSLSLISHWPVPVREDSPLDVLLTFFPVTV